MSIVHLPNDSLEIITRNEDLIDLVKIHMGFEISQLVKELAEEADENKARLEGDFRSYEMQLEDNQSAFGDLCDELNSLSSELSKSKLNRKALMEIVIQMERIVNNQI